MINTYEMTKWMRLKIIEMAHSAGKKGAHLGSALSCVELLACLYSQIMDVSPENILTHNHDIFIPSKAHCVLSYYSALSYCGFFPIDDLLTFENNLSELSGHPVRNLQKGIEFSGGSLGMGFSQGVGMALGLKQHNLNQRVFVLLGDGECDEGAIWEAAQSASHFHLDNLIIIVDHNKLQYDGCTNDVMNLMNLKSKFTSFGFCTYEVDGHNIDDIISTFHAAFKESSNKPIALIANTVKGKGISFMENQKKWHHGVLSTELYNQALIELGGCNGVI